ncbi:MAG TPA: hypothetical protein VGF30_10670 [Bacteroidia bacterium]
MIRYKFISTLFLTIFLLLLSGKSTSCSMYKVTAGNKTNVGSNYDAYYLTSRIWFETAKKTGEYGCIFSGGRLESASTGFSPQSGMNEFGLFFCGAATPPVTVSSDSKKIQIPSRAIYLKAILQHCKTIEDVKEYVSKHDRSAINADIFLYVDPSGKYIIVEPDTLIVGTDATCVLSNFCRSTTKEEDALKMGKYRKGIEFLKHHVDTGIAFCRNLSDTMSVCRPKMGDGTLLTSIADLNNREIYYYFYHDFKHSVKFNLKNELAKGDHVFEVPKLFPLNKEYEAHKSFQTPQHNTFIRTFMFACVGIFFISSIYFFISFFIKIRKTQFVYAKLIMSFLSITLSAYSLILIRDETIFYFPAPYKDPGSALLSLSGYVPFLILLVIIPLLFIAKKIYSQKLWGGLSRWAFIINNSIFIIYLGLFAYWGLFNIFN